MLVSEIELFNLLKTKIGEQEAKVLVEYVETKVEKSIAERTTTLATKEDTARIETKIAEPKAELLKWMILLFAPFYVGMIVFLVKQFL